MGWPRAKGQDEPPFALIEKERGALRIAAVDSAAAKAGLGVGMALAQARTLCPALETAEADPAADAAFLRRAADVCDMFTPLVALRGGDGLILDITGCAHLFGGERALAGRAQRRLAALGLAASAAISGTPHSAWALARHRGGVVAAAGEEEAAARALPIAALDQDAATAGALGRAGFRSLGDLADRPSGMLAARFGAGLVDALRRVLGHEDIRITPLRPAPEIMAEKHFPEPIARTEDLIAVLGRLADDVGGALQQRGAGGRVFEASVFRSDGLVRRIRIETAQATRDAAILMRLMRLRIESLADPLDPGFGFDALRLAVLRGEPLREAQRDFEAGAAVEDEARAVGDLVNRLVARFGRENVQRFMTHDTHDPARAGAVAPYLSEAPSGSWAEPEPGQPPLRPLTLFVPPQPIEVMAAAPDSPPMKFRWRRALHEVASAEGPERIAPEWWTAPPSAPATRDYYRVEDVSGHRFWIFREGFYEDSAPHPRWFMHGLFA